MVGISHRLTLSSLAAILSLWHQSCLPPADNILPWFSLSETLLDALLTICAICVYFSEGSMTVFNARRSMLLGTSVRRLMTGKGYACVPHGPSWINKQTNKCQDSQPPVKWSHLYGKNVTEICICPISNKLFILVMNCIVGDDKKLFADYNMNDHINCSLITALSNKSLTHFCNIPCLQTLPASCQL